MAVAKKQGGTRKPDILAYMECYEEEQSPAQKAAYSKAENDYLEMLSKIEALTRQSGPEQLILVPVSNNAQGQPSRTTKKGMPVRQSSTMKKTLGLQGQKALVVSPKTTTSTYQIVVNQRSGVISSVTPTMPPVESGSGIPGKATTTAMRGGTATRGRGFTRQVMTKPVNNPTSTFQGVTPPPKISVATKQATPKVVVPSTPTTRAKGKELSEVRKSGYVPDSKEINFNKLSGRTFPSLVVVARPTLKIKTMTPQAINKERAYIDGKVKQVLMYTATKFTEWLIQQGLIRSEQCCSTHVDLEMNPVKFKLGMYSDVTKFPYSGGYVWISECCPQRFISVFSGSIFEGAPYPPNTIVKLMYHWSVQTNVQNIVQWVKVENLYVKTFFTNLRSVCTAAVHEKFDKLGGSKKNVEVGVISLGTTTTDGSNRQVKIEVLGIMETESKIIRLKAVEPSLDAEKNYKKRFSKILEPLEEWVHKDTLILTDFTVDKNTLHTMGYTHVFQVSVTEGSNVSRYSNVNIMEYLRRVVPRMFQNTLSLLSRQIIQQFLDEVVWRERWGYVPSKAFDNIIAHAAEQTKLETGDTVLSRLQKVALNPFKDWQYTNWKANCLLNFEMIKPMTPDLPDSSTATRRPSLRKRSVAEAQTATSEKSGSAATTTSAPETNLAELMPLDNYYYGTIPGDKDLIDQEFRGQLNMKCCICNTVQGSNIQMMKHLINHAYNDGPIGKEDSKTPQCRYCLRNFVSDFQLQNHLEETHLKTGPALMCYICEEKFRDRTTLILHMHRNHHELELPYECGICAHRTSQHMLAVNHFYEVHCFGEKAQCPFCLKIIAFAHNGKKITQNLYFFLNHIQKHKRKLIARKCNKCALWFVHKNILIEHQNKDHLSFKDTEDVVRYPKSGLDVIMMPKPLSPGPSMEKFQPPKPKETYLNSNFSMMSKYNFAIHGAPDGSLCCECEGDLLSEDHFTGKLLCHKCKYMTNCSSAMADHVATAHESRYSKDVCVGKKIKLDNYMHCVCGYKCVNGNKLAKHLALCGKGRKSAYPSQEKAAASSVFLESESTVAESIDEVAVPEVPVDTNNRLLRAYRRGRISKDEQESEKEKTEPGSGDHSSMLGVLGLVRKTSTDECSIVSDQETGVGETDETTQNGKPTGNTQNDIEPDSAIGTATQDSGRVEKQTSYVDKEKESVAEEDKETDSDQGIDEDIENMAVDQESEVSKKDEN